MEKVLTHKRYYESKIENISNWEVSEKEKNSVRQYIKDYETGKVTGRIGTNKEALIERLLDFLKIALESINKDTPTKKDVEDFFDDLLKDKICKTLFSKDYREQQFKKKVKEGYALKSKQGIFSALEKYLKWKFSNKPELLQPLQIKIKIKKKSPPALSEQEVDKLRKDAGDVENRATISILYSSGARAEEFYNIRYSDVILPKGEESFVKLVLREEFTKTEGRTISLYYKYALEDFRELLEKRKQEGCKPEEPVFQKKYRTQRDWLRALGKRVLGKPVYFHLFRHSSATKNASKMNRQQLCIYYGWKFNSPMPDVYIKREGVEMQQIDKEMQQTELEDLKRNLEAEKTKSSMQIDSLRKAQEELKAEVESRKDYDSVLNDLLSLPQVQDILRRKKKLEVLGK